jgi:putative transposase
LGDLLPGQSLAKSSHEPGSPWQNGHAESFVSRLRAELLDVEVFYNLADAQVKLSLFRRFYNAQRPHSSLGYKTPTQAVLSCKQGYS